ncbi:MAG: ATP-binding protein [Planctomycetales bacterium]|nr:ATP-binding protein [Planctomycetales bacterium]
MTEPSIFKPQLLIEALAENSAGLPLRMTEELARDANGRVVIACNGLEIDEYASLGLCELSLEPQPRADHYCTWGGEDNDQLVDNFDQVVWRVAWNNRTLHVVHIEWATGCGSDERDWVLADSEELAREFILDVARRTHHPGESILVFSDGHWERSRSLYQATQSASFDDLVLADNLKQSIREDFKSFLVSQNQYERLGIAWRRGALMIGPPGNGKTHCVRALVKELGVPSLYVQSLSHPYWTPEQLWKQVFNRARGLRPCVLVLEDLDSLVTEENRSFFLNQLDGFERNQGLIVLATTNYPERIDSAIIDRPSRFDRKYHFELPTLASRQTYLCDWQARLADETGWTAEQAASIAAMTSGFSFAYLKELVISSVMQWMANRSEGFAAVATEQARTLKRQMRTDPDAGSQASGFSLFRWRNGSRAVSTDE